MKTVVFYRSSSEMEKARALFPAHKARLDAFHARGDLIAVGAWADPREGAMAIFRSRAAAEEFIREDPFVVQGVVASHEIKDWNEIYLG